MKYRTLVVDPPWPITWRGYGPSKRSVGQPPEYGLMPLAEIEQLPVSGLAEPDAHLFLWVTAQLNREGVGVRVARGWGFTVRSEIVWAKRNPGMGAFPRPAHEILLVCSRGKLPFRNATYVPSVQVWKQLYDKNSGKRDSAKPDGSYDLIEQVSPGPYVELFARRHRLGWDVWGNESANTATLEAPA